LRIARLCEALGVARGAYYAWDKRPESKREKRRNALKDKVKKEFFSNRQIPGATKISKQLSSPEHPVGRRVVARIMRENGWKSKVVRKYKATTNSKHNLPVAENLLNREFTAERPNQKWLSDITYVATDEGWLYVACTLDLYGREIVGWSMGERMTKDLVIDCLKQANTRRDAPQGVMVHSDRGSQYCSRDYQQLLARSNHICSMSIS